ncbi:hypothetical protein [Mailhella massiliensis]|uniref:hypothetical protein n=1 Tax=Mailhella massiliensis TaxID=1903261 RepID=UPI0023532A88|nr:hypothetical protein [Mailhella massiliensis]
MLPLGTFPNYGKPNREQTIRLIQIWNHEYPEETPMEITEATIESMSCVAQYDAYWEENIKKYEGVEL